MTATRSLIRSTATAKLNYLAVDGRHVARAFVQQVWRKRGAPSRHGGSVVCQPGMAEAWCFASEPQPSWHADYQAAERAARAATPDCGPAVRQWAAELNPGRQYAKGAQPTRRDTHTTGLTRRHESAITRRHDSASTHSRRLLSRYHGPATATAAHLANLAGGDTHSQGAERGRNNGAMSP